MARIIIGNVTVSGFVNLVAAGRIVIGTGSYQAKDGTKVFKESVTVFLDDKFDGEVPSKGDYVKVSGEMQVSPRKDQADQLNATVNVRFANQLEKQAAPTKRAEATESSDDI